MPIITRLSTASRRPNQLAGSRPEPAKSPGEMASRVTHLIPLERFLLRRSVGELEADRHRCSDCGRTPLTGEQVHLYSGREHRIVCELCRPRRSELPPRARSCATASTATRFVSPPARPSHPYGPAAHARAGHGSEHHGASVAGEPATWSMLTRLALAVDPVTVSIVVSAPPRGGVRLPAGHRQPPRVHRPLSRRLASHTDRLGRTWSGRALSHQGARATASAGATSRFAEVDRPHRIVEVGRTGKNNRDPHARRLRPLARRRRHDARHLHAPDDPCDPV